jgi:hypothetical protein
VPDILASLLERSTTVFNNVGFIGSGPIAQALAHHLVAARIPVYVSNSRGPHTLTELMAELGDAAQAVTVEQAAKADLVILALPFLRVPELADVVPDWSDECKRFPTVCLVLPARAGPLSAKELKSGSRDSRTRRTTERSRRRAQLRHPDDRWLPTTRFR